MKESVQPWVSRCDRREGTVFYQFYQLYSGHIKMTNYFCTIIIAAAFTMPPKGRISVVLFSLSRVEYCFSFFFFFFFEVRSVLCFGSKEFRFQKVSFWPIFCRKNFILSKATILWLRKSSLCILINYIYFLSNISTSFHYIVLILIYTNTSMQ